jgi:hypothetical protein
MAARRPADRVDALEHRGADDDAAQQRQQQSGDQSDSEGADDQRLHVPEGARILTDEKIIVICEAIAARPHLPNPAIKEQTERRRSHDRRHRFDVADDLMSVAALKKVDGANVFPQAQMVVDDGGKAYLTRELRLVLNGSKLHCYLVVRPASRKPWRTNTSPEEDKHGKRQQAGIKQCQPEARCAKEPNPGHGGSIRRREPYGSTPG